MFNSDISFLWILSSKRFLKKLKTQLQKGMNIKQLQALSHGHLTSANTPKLVVLLILSICRRANEWIFCRTDFRWLLLHLVLPSNLKFYRFKHSAFFCVWKCEFMRSLHSVFFPHTLSHNNQYFLELWLYQRWASFFWLRISFEWGVFDVSPFRFFKEHFLQAYNHKALYKKHI